MHIEKLPVALACFGRDVRDKPVPLPPIKKFGESDLRRVDVITLIRAGFEPDQLGLGLALAALVAVVARQAFAGDRIGAEVKLNFPRALAAAADVTCHFLLPKLNLMAPARIIWTREFYRSPALA